MENKRRKASRHLKILVLMGSSAIKRKYIKYRNLISLIFLEYENLISSDIEQFQFANKMWPMTG